MSEEWSLLTEHLNEFHSAVQELNQSHSLLLSHRQDSVLPYSQSLTKVVSNATNVQLSQE